MTCEWFLVWRTNPLENMKRCLRFFKLKNWIFPNLAKYCYKWLPLEQHHKIEKKKTLPTLSPSNMWLVLSMKNRSFGNICHQRKEFLAFHLLLSIASIPQLLTCSFVEGYKEMAWSPYKNMHGTQKRFSL